MLKELLYPFDANHLLENKRKIRKQLLEEGASFIEKKIAILGGSTTAAIRQMMELFLLNNGIKPEFYESEYNKFYEDAVFDNEQLKQFAPDIIYVDMPAAEIPNYPTGFGEITMEGMFDFEYKQDLLDQWEY